MGLLEDLDAFCLEHYRCGELDTEVWEDMPGRQRIWMGCSCGACLNREATGRVVARSALWCSIS